MPRAIHYVGGDTAWNFHQFEPGLPQSCFPLHPLAPISSMGQHQCVPGRVVCISSPSTTKEHPCKWWVVAFCQSGSVAHPTPALPMEQGPKSHGATPWALHGTPCDALGSCRLLSCSKFSNLECEVCRISPYISIIWFPHILFFSGFWGEVWPCWMQHQGASSSVSFRRSSMFTFPLFCIF